jgi:hypothetical protein
MAKREPQGGRQILMKRGSVSCRSKSRFVIRLTRPEGRHLIGRLVC